MYVVGVARASIKTNRLSEKCKNYGLFSRIWMIVSKEATFLRSCDKDRVIFLLFSFILAIGMPFLIMRWM